MNLLSGGASFIPDNPCAKVAEPFTWLAFDAEAGENGANFGHDVIAFDGVFVEAIQASTALISAEIDLVFIGGFADEGDFGGVRPGAAIGAAGHANNQFLVRHAKIRENGLDAGGEAGEGALGFGKGEAASRQSRAGHGSEPGAAEGVCDTDAML